MSTQTPPAGPLRARLVPLALVFSGFGALAVEVLWQRLLTRVLGGTTNAVTAVLIAYMAGLAIGSAIAGRQGDRLSPRAALRAYVGLEVVIWLAASLVTVVLASVPVGLGGLLTALGEGTPRFLARFAIAALLLLLPTIAMGATLPLVVRAASGGRRDALLSSTGQMYAANTLGAVLGALAGPFVLMPALGVRGATLAAACGSLLAAGIASFATPAGDVAASPGEGDTGTEPAEPTAPVLLVSAAAFATGAAALGLQVLWTRWLATLGGSTVYSFGLVVAVVLLGIVLGSTAVALAARRLSPRDVAVAAGLLSLIGAGGAVLLLPVVELVPPAFERLGASNQLSVWSVLLMVSLAALVMILPPTVCFGAVLPLGVRAVRSAGGASAAAVGRVYAANTVGALLGAGATGLGLVAALGLARSAVALSAVPVAAGTALLLAIPGLSRRQRALFLVLGLGAAASLVNTYLPSPYAGAARAFVPRRGQEQARILYYGEGPEASVLVEANREQRSFYVNSRIEASTQWADVRTQYVLAHLPALLAGGAPRSLVVGLGSGMTAGALTRWGAVTVAEINHTVPGATRRFADYNHDVVDRADLRIEDGRVILAEAGPPYALVTTDPIHPGVSGAASLYTLEHFLLSRRRLAPGGVISLWVPLYQMGQEEVRGIIGTFLDVFPDAELYLNREQATLIGGGRPRDAAGSLELIRAGWKGDVAGDLLRGRIESPEALAVSRVAGPHELRRYVGSARRHHDDDPWIELSLARYLYNAPLPAIVSSLLKLRPPEQARLPMVRAFDALQRSHTARLWQAGELAVKVLRETLVDGRSPLLEHALELREASARLARAMYGAGRTAEALALARAEAVEQDATPASLLDCREVLWGAKQYALLDALDARLVAQWPDRPEGHYATGQDLFERGRIGEAIVSLERVAAMDAYPGYQPPALALLGRAYLQSGDLEKGRAALRRSIELQPEQPIVRGLLAAAAADPGRGAKAN
jgi:spermidine synthase